MVYVRLQKKEHQFFLMLLSRKERYENFYRLFVVFRCSSFTPRRRNDIREFYEVVKLLCLRRIIFLKLIPVHYGFYIVLVLTESICYIVKRRIYCQVFHDALTVATHFFWSTFAIIDFIPKHCKYVMQKLFIGVVIDHRLRILVRNRKVAKARLCHPDI